MAKMASQVNGGCICVYWSIFVFSHGFSTENIKFYCAPCCKLIFVFLSVVFKNTNISFDQTSIQSLF